MYALAPRGVGSWDQTFLDAIVTGAQRTDPELAEIVQLAREIIAVERGPGGALDPRTPSTFKVSDLRWPLKTYLGYRRQPLLFMAVPVGDLGDRVPPRPRQSIAPTRRSDESLRVRARGQRPRA